MDNVIEMKNLSHSYNIGQEKLEVLHNINFNVEKGEFVAVLGPSGSGKSTLMNIIGCMDKASEGEYMLDGENIRDMNERNLTKVRGSKIGFVFQKYQLIPRYTVIDNIIMPLLAKGYMHKAAIEKCENIIEMLALQNRLHHKPNELSGGQQQRVAIARALCTNPCVLLADEPTGALDSATGREVLSLFEQVNQMGNTVIMITHDLNVAKFARRVVHIEDGILS